MSTKVEKTESEKKIANLVANYDKAELASRLYEATAKLKELTEVEKKQDQVEKAVIAKAELAHGMSKLDNGFYAVVELSYDLKTGAAVISKVTEVSKDVQIAYHGCKKESVEKVYLPCLR